MENFAKILAAVGVVIALLSLVLMPYNAAESAAYQMCLVDAVLGFIMFAFGVGYLLFQKRTEIKNKKKKGKVETKV